MPLQREIWIAGIQENPIPDTSFVFASTDKSEFVENNKLHLAEAGVEPKVHKNYFKSAETDLPLQKIVDIPNEVLLDTYSTERTRHRNLQEIELQYNRRESIIKRHRLSLAKELSVQAAQAWSPNAADEFNKILKLENTDSIVDAIIDLEAFYNSLDIYDGINLCLNADHMARIKKEDKLLFKDILSSNTLYGFKVFRYNKTPLYNEQGDGKVTEESGRGSTARKSSFTWVTNEVFRCFGDVHMYETLNSAASQADELSFAQRALVGNIRAAKPKYLGAII